MTKEIWIDAPPELVFPYLVQPDLATAWMGDESWNDPRPGGVFRLSSRTTLELTAVAQTLLNLGWVMTRRSITGPLDHRSIRGD